MKTATQKTVDIHQLRNMILDAGSIEEIKALNAFIPELSVDEKIIARKSMDDGIYDANGTLIGEKHPHD